MPLFQYSNLSFNFALCHYAVFQLGEKNVKDIILLYGSFKNINHNKNNKGIPIAYMRVPVPNHSVAISNYEGAIPNYEGATPDYEGAISNYEGAISNYEGAIPNYEGATPDYEGAISNCEGAIPNIHHKFVQNQPINQQNQ